jgi:hypothetical protein
MRRTILAVAVCVCAAAAAAQAPASQARAFVPVIDNPWLPFKSGTEWVYRGVKDGKPARDVVRVTATRRVIDGVRCTAVSDRLYLNGKLGERTTDWYAQDSHGTVWYYGEATAELNAKGRVTSTEGSWLAGLDGAKPGIIMPARPHVGQSARQEYLQGHAEDHFQVLSLTSPVHVPYVTSKHALLTKEWTPLEPGVVDHKVYVPGIGMVKEETVKGGDERSVLVSLRRG